MRSYRRLRALRVTALVAAGYFHAMRPAGRPAGDPGRDFHAIAGRWRWREPRMRERERRRASDRRIRARGLVLAAMYVQAHAQTRCFRRPRGLAASDAASR